MKKRLLIPLSALALLTMVGCSINLNNTTNTGTNTTDTSEYGSDYDYNDEITVEEPETIEEVETNTEFEIVTEDGEYTKSDSVYTITKAGTYTLAGKLEGQILIEAGDDDEVVCC